MGTVSSALFRTVAPQDHLGFFANQFLQPQRVAEFLDLKKDDVARVAGVARTSVRWDNKIPKEVMDRLTEIANVCELVAQFFEGDRLKTALWFKTKNPLLGNLSPRDMIRFGRYEKLQRFVLDALAENNGRPVAQPAAAPEPAHAATKTPVV